MGKLHFLFFILFTCAVPILAQQDSTEVIYDTTPLEVQEIEAQDLQKYDGDKDFDYEVIKMERTWWDDFKTWLGNLFLRFFEWLFGTEKAAGFLATFLRLVPYLLFGVLIYILIRFFLNLNARTLQQAKKDGGLVSLSEEEHLIKNEDIQQLIQKALAEKNYRLAIRYYYLFLLQLMTEKELIVWELQKTNDDYLREIKKTELKKPFSNSIRLYDHVWYGDFPIDESKYHRAEKVFSSLQQMVNGNG